MRRGQNERRPARKPAERTGRHPRYGSRYEHTDGEPTLVGDERSDEIPRYPVLALVHTHVIQRRVIVGLDALLVEVLALGLMAMVGVAKGWFTGTFALELLGITITPSFAAWIIVVKWAFPRKDD